MEKNSQGCELVEEFVFVFLGGEEREWWMSVRAVVCVKVCVKHPRPPPPPRHSRGWRDIDRRDVVGVYTNTNPTPHPPIAPKVTALCFLERKNKKKEREFEPFYVIGGAVCVCECDRLMRAPSMHGGDPPEASSST